MAADNNQDSEFTLEVGESALETHHRQEWDTSAVDPLIRELNVKSLSGNAMYERVLRELPRTARRNDGRLRDNILKQYGHLEKGGWWTNGLDPYENWNSMEWGRCKPDEPRLEWDRKTQKYGEKKVKYESPPNTPTRVTYFRVPLHVWKAVAARYSVAMPEQVEVTAQGEAIGFWAWVQQHAEIDVILTEGEKKAACLLSFGFAAIALPGIWNGRVGKENIEHLHPDLMAMAQPGRTYIIVFDYETKPQTKENICQAIRRTGYTIEQAGCKCEVAQLPGPDKGVDDWAVAQGENAEESLTRLIGDTLTLADYQTVFHYHRRRGLVRFKPDVQVNCRYLSDQVKLPNTGLICIKSGMGSGKTELIARRRQEFPDERFANIGHRVSLLKNLAQRLQTDIYSDLDNQKLGSVSSLSITIDSLYKLANDLQSYDCLLIDEASQFVGHLLTSSTCQKFRHDILQVLRFLVYQARLVILADAHLDDVTIRFFQAMRCEGEQPYIIQNNYCSGGRKVFFYESQDNSEIVASLHSEIMAGKKVLVVSSTKRFPKTLERALLKQCRKIQREDKGADPPLLRVWTIHGENSGSKENVDFIKDINNAVKTVDVLNVSPSLGTGIDISDYHFDVIYGIFDGDAFAATDAAQQLWRYRPNVPMHVWVRPRPSFGYQEVNTRRIRASMIDRNKMTAFLIRIDPTTGSKGTEDEWILDTYCQMKAQHNWSVNNLREDLRLLLEEMGNTIILVGGDRDEDASAWMKEARNEITQEYCESVAKAKDIDRSTYEYRQHQDYLKPEEIFECQKYIIHEFYGMTVTPELVKKHDEGRLIKQIISLEAIQEKPEPGTVQDDAGREFPLPPSLVTEHDRQNRERHKISLDWSHRSTEWLMRYRLGLQELVAALMDGEEIASDDPKLEALAEKAINAAPHIKSVLGLTIAPTKSPMWIFSQFLQQFGLSTVSRRLGSRDSRVRYYALNPDDIEFTRQVLTWRQQQREERERQRQADVEAAQRQAEAMSNQYGINSCPYPPSIYIDPLVPPVDTTSDKTAEQEEKWWM